MKDFVGGFVGLVMAMVVFFWLLTAAAESLDERLKHRTEDVLTAPQRAEVVARWQEVRP